MDSFFLEHLPVRPCTINLIGQDFTGIKTKAIFVFFNIRLHVASLIKSIPTQFIQEADTINKG
jgi:hypothetical protein